MFIDTLKQTLRFIEKTYVHNDNVIGASPNFSTVNVMLRERGSAHDAVKAASYYNNVGMKKLK